jgi:NDP-sugar pyrophosphorylase family protein
VLQNVLTGEVNHMDVPGIQIEPGLWTGLNTSIDWNGTTIKGPVYIGSGVKIEAGVHHHRTDLDRPWQPYLRRAPKSSAACFSNILAC